MAKILSPILSAAAGSVGGASYQRSSSGQRITARSVPAQPRTPAQVNQRQLMAQVSTSWRSLDPASQQTWNVLAAQLRFQDRLGSSLTKSGFALFVGVNLPSIALGYGAVNVPPSPLPNNAPASITSCVVVADPIPSSNLVQLQLGVFNPVALYLLSCTLPFSPGRSNLQRVSYSTMGLYAADGGGMITAFWPAADPSHIPVIGQRTGLKLQTFNPSWLLGQPSFSSGVA